MANESFSPLFALDIGTRSVVGLLLKQKDEQYELLDLEIIEHHDRSMLDGQIHDVPAVAMVIQKVKSKLEEKHGPLKKVCVAAAGRSLKTKRASFDIDIKGKPMFERDDLLHLELSAVQQAQYALAQEQESESLVHYYCVGYSVLTYRLDGEPIGSLLDQSGHTATVEVIATFLPKVVVESLLAALSRVNLELEALTLEPIAAINVLIPPSMRRLNVALVDIGAGTSDIALTDENTVTAYGMVPVAGDEITEAISDHFLLDFPDAENVKRQLIANDEITMQDILGFETTYSRSDILSPIHGAIQRLAQSISDEILRLNGQAPKAVMLVGGGSLTPELPKFISRCLALPENRVAIRGIDAIKNLILQDTHKFGPELVTPIGIAIAAKENPIEYVSVKVNEQTLRLFDVKRLTVGDGLLAAGVDISKLYGKPGLAIMVTVEDRLISIPGQHGKPPLLLKNGEPTSLDAPLKAGDEVVVKRGNDGEQANLTINELIGDVPTIHVMINEQDKTIPAKILRNGMEVNGNEAVHDRDIYKLIFPKTIRDALQQLKLPLDQFSSYKLLVNDEEIKIPSSKKTLSKNGQPAQLDDPIYSKDILNWQDESTTTSPPSVKDILKLQNINSSQTMTIFFNDEEVTLEKPLVDVLRKDTKLKLEDKVHQDDHLTIETRNAESFILQDIFTKVNIDLSNTTNKTLYLKRNGEDTNFSSPIYDGDKIQLFFNESYN
ncbi:cell division protein FtsA [Halalkalibacter urbisdiaboli]|uniref:cell division protein FtsA n=1 Tax=Halalkalibacter urbisdiaboli TaxID=1960589 RepID=UPI000B44991C|nr:cell division protein FtsA [Halalkalibacter urbisdiaboli]